MGRKMYENKFKDIKQAAFWYITLLSLLMYLETIKVRPSNCTGMSTVLLAKDFALGIFKCDPSEPPSLRK